MNNHEKSILRKESLYSIKNGDVLRLNTTYKYLYCDSENCNSIATVVHEYVIGKSADGVSPIDVYVHCTKSLEKIYSFQVMSKLLSK